MWSKIVKIVMAASIFLGFGLLIPINQASAIGADTVVKLVGGKMVVRSLAEKAGLSLSSKQLDNVVDLIETKTYKGDTETIAWVNKVNNLTPSATPATKTGFKKYILEPVAWLTGLDLIFEAVDAFSDAYDSGAQVELLEQEYPEWGFGQITTGSSVGVNVWLTHPKNNAQLNDIYADGNSGSTVKLNIPTDYTSYELEVVSMVKDDSKTGDFYFPVIDLTYTTSSETIKKHDDKQMVESLDMTGYLGEVTRDRSITSVDVPDVTNVTPKTKTHFDNDTYDRDTDTNVEVEMPDNPDYDDETPWNEKDTQIDVDVDVEVNVDVDTDNDGTRDTDDLDDDNDGIPDSQDSDDDNDGISDDEDDGTPSRGEPVDWLVVVDDEIPIHEKFFLEMADVGQKIEDMYNGTVHFFQVSVDGFTSLTDGMTGFVSFLDSFFDWLPDEYVALLGSGFTLGVVAFFLRR